MATLSTFALPSWPDPKCNAIFLSEPIDNTLSIADSPMTADDHTPQSPPDPNPNVHSNPFLEISTMPWPMAKTLWSWKKERRKRAGLSRSHHFNPTKA
ncbi:hypothetical protein GBA52_004104 [Prunus armeniaca]|nr:hypothetical protein GBA52_004104 [Prunus armeniaca]